MARKPAFEPRRGAAGQTFEYAAGGELHRFSADEKGIVRPSNDAEERVAARFGLTPAPEAADAGESEEANRDELYARAQELDIEGRSTMNKEELAAAIAAAERDNTSGKES